MREILVKPLGLITRPNIYGQYPIGGMLTAQNLVMRAPGILESAPALVTGVSFGASNDVVHDLFPLDSGKMGSISRTPAIVWTHRVDSTTSTVQLPLTSILFSPTGRITSVRSRDRVLMNTIDQGMGVIDGTNPTPPATIRSAGLQQAQFQTFGATLTNAVAIAINACVGYAAVYRRVQSDGYELIGKPSPIWIYRNTGIGVVDPQPTIQCRAANGLIAGDYIDLYRTDIVSNAVITTDPGTTLKRIDSTQITAGNLAAGFFTFTDSTLPGPLGVTNGQALYTNPGQKGLTGGHRQPDIAACMAIFKSYTFLANIKERPQLIFQIPGGIGDTTVAGYNNAAWRTNGIGTRRIAGTVTLGSANITGVSATDMLGIVQGQLYLGGVGGATFPGGTTVSSAGGTTVTMSANATAGGTGVDLRDRIEVFGSVYTTGSNPQQFAFNFNTGVPQLEITTDGALFPLEDPTQGINLVRWIIEPIRPNTGATLTVRATNGANYVPPLTEFALAATTIPYNQIKNKIRWSNDSQPEHFPAPNEDSVGTGEIIALEPTRDALWIFCTDGLFRLSGDGGQWRVDVANSTLVLASPRASCVLKEAVYAYTNQGLMRITDAGVEPLSDAAVGDILPGLEYSETASIILAANETDDEVIIRVDATQVYVYNTLQQCFTTVLHPDVTALAYARYPVSGLPALAFGRSPSGSAPSYSLWNATNSFLAPTGRFHPLFDQNPYVSKQWVDGTWIFDAASVGKSLTPSWNGNTFNAALLKAGGQYFNESRSVLGVPRRAATGMTLAPGYAFGALSTSTKLYALSVRFNQLSEQGLHR